MIHRIKQTSSLYKKHPLFLIVQFLGRQNSPFFCPDKGVWWKTETRDLPVPWYYEDMYRYQVINMIAGQQLHMKTDGRTLYSNCTGRLLEGPYGLGTRSPLIFCRLFLITGTCAGTATHSFRTSYGM